MLKSNYKILFALFLLTLASCESTTSKSFQNKKIYKVKVGESFRIYYSTNSCCHYCIPNKVRLKTVEILKTIQVDPGEGCMGCSYVGAFVVKTALSKRF